MLSLYRYLCVFVSSSLPIPLLPNQIEQLLYRRQMANETGTFPAVDAEKELNPEQNKEFEVDPVSSKVAEVKVIVQFLFPYVPNFFSFPCIYIYSVFFCSSQERKAEEEKKRSRKKDAVEMLKSRIVICGIVVVVVGAVFAMTRKLKEK